LLLFLGTQIALSKGDLRSPAGCSSITRTHQTTEPQAGGCQLMLISSKHYAATLGQQAPSL
jgi:hypothetical protein